MITARKHIISWLATAALTSVATTTSAFELLSEGAMDTVSAVSAESVEEILNVAGSTAAGLVDDDYEVLPFATDVSPEELVLDEVDQELDFAFTQEVEAWVENLRQQGSNEQEIEVGLVEDLPSSSFDDVQTTVPANVIQTRIQEYDVVDADDLQYQFGRIEQTIETLDSGVDTISYRVERYIERAATIDARPFVDQPSVGSGYITELRGQANVTLTAIRD